MPLVRDDLGWLSALDLARLIRGKEVSPVEVMSSLLARIEALNPRLNAYCTVAADEASDLATAAEIGVLTGEPLGPLHGLPVSIKDLLFTRRMRTTAGSQLLVDHVPEEDAVAVERLRGAGAIIVGKTNTPEFGHKGITDSPLFGPTRNPWNPALTAGGGDRRRRVHPHPRVLLRDLRPQALLRTRAVGTGPAGLGDALPYRAHDPHRPRRRADAGRARRP